MLDFIFKSFVLSIAIVVSSFVLSNAGEDMARKPVVQLTGGSAMEVVTIDTERPVARVAAAPIVVQTIATEKPVDLESFMKPTLKLEGQVSDLERRVTALEAKYSTKAAVGGGSVGTTPSVTYKSVPVPRVVQAAPAVTYRRILPAAVPKKGTCTTDAYGRRVCN